MLELLEGRFFKTFITVLEEKSFSRAAEKLGYVQSTVTTHIQALEKTCGKKLFHRLSRGVKPTETGLKLAKFAYQFIQLSHSLEETLNDLDEPQGTIHIRMPESFFLKRMSSFLQQFMSDYPKAKLRLESGFQPDIVNQVLDHIADFGIVPRNPQRDDIIFSPLVTEKLIFIANHALADKVESEGIEILNKENVISFGSSCLFHTEANKVFQEIGIEESRTLEFPSSEMIKEAVKCGVGYALVPEITVIKELEEGQLRTLLLSKPIVTIHGLIVHKDRELNTPSKLFKSQVIDYFSNRLQIS